MFEIFKRVFWSVVKSETEPSKVMEFLSRCSIATTNGCSVIDVGCGFGRYLGQLSKMGLDVTGVDANPDIVEANREAGFRCLTTEEFSRTNETYDALLMSHVIEHFAPKDLLPFLDAHLDRLKVGGSLIIATPLLTPYFYDDFDHIKPYHPMGIMMVFGTENAQVQYYSRNKLTLEDVWIRRSPLPLPHTCGRYLTSFRARPRQAAMLLSAVVFRLSGGFIGEASGWVGRFRKIG
ncbi:MAG: methyltransferase domain-containing protein [Nitrospira sp.]|nr:methyltransferase domain-containing protein [Nitrospira sp.]